MSITVHGRIEAPLDSVWSIISDFSGLKRWHPAVVDCISTGNNVGSVRTVRMSMQTVQERLDYLSEDDHSLGYSVIAMEPSGVLMGISGLIRLKAAGPSATDITWTAGLGVGSSEEKETADKILGAYYPARIEHLRACIANTLGIGDASD